VCNKKQAVEFAFSRKLDGLISIHLFIDVMDTEKSVAQLSGALFGVVWSEAIRNFFPTTTVYKAKPECYPYPGVFNTCDVSVDLGTLGLDILPQLCDLAFHVCNGDSDAANFVRDTGSMGHTSDSGGTGFSFGFQSVQNLLITAKLCAQLVVPRNLIQCHNIPSSFLTAGSYL
jgi:hypothetical protein